MLLLPTAVIEAIGSNDTQSNRITITTHIVGEVEEFALAGDGMATIDWGDGTGVQNVLLRNVPRFTEDMYFRKGWLVPHTYTKSGKKTIVITGNVTGLVVIMRGMATAIDVSRMPGLKVLDCRNQRLTSLDINHNAALLELRCSGNRLSTLDVSGLAELRFLWCDGNGLSALNISGCTLIELFCERNNLTSLDAGGMAAIPRVIHCNDNLMQKAALIKLFSSLPERNYLYKIYCAGNPGYEKLTEEDRAAAREKGWSVLSRWEDYQPF